MKNKIIICMLSILLLSHCAQNPLAGENWAPEKASLPKIFNTNLINLSKITRISRFRSSAGHDYSDLVEQQRSMKHYFLPLTAYGNSKDNIEVYAPLNGTITMVLTESTRSAQVRVVPKDYPYLTIVYFHIATTLAVGATVTEGQIIGYADTTSNNPDQPTSDFDIALWLSSGRLISIFDVMTDTLFAQYQARGVTDRDDLKLTKEQADANPVTFPSGNQGDWKDLNAP